LFEDQVIKKSNGIKCKAREIRDPNKIDLLGVQVIKEKMIKFMGYK